MKHVEGIVIDRDGNPLNQSAPARDSKLRLFAGSIISNPLKLAVALVVGLPIAALLLTLFGLVFIFAMLFGRKSFVKIIKF